MLARIRKFLVLFVNRSVRSYCVIFSKIIDETE